MSAYHTFILTRTTEPHFEGLIAALRALDVTAAPNRVASNVWTVKKATAWTNPQRTAAQNVLDTAPAVTPQLAAQAEVDAIRPFDRALVLALIDEINILRGLHGLAPRTEAQAIAALRARAGALPSAAVARATPVTRKTPKRKARR